MENVENHCKKNGVRGRAALPTVEPLPPLPEPATASDIPLLPSSISESKGRLPFFFLSPAPHPHPPTSYFLSSFCFCRAVHLQRWFCVLHISQRFRVNCTAIGALQAPSMWQHLAGRPAKWFLRDEQRAGFCSNFQAGNGAREHRRWTRGLRR